LHNVWFPVAPLLAAELRVLRLVLREDFRPQIARKNLGGAPIAERNYWEGFEKNDVSDSVNSL